MKKKKTLAALEQPYILLGNLEACHRVLLKDILYCLGSNTTTEFRTTHAKRIVVTGHSLAHYDKLLVPFGFLRIHQSVLLNTCYLSHICKGDDSMVVVLTTGERLNMSRGQKQEVLQWLQEQSIEPPAGVTNSKPNKPDSKKSKPDSQKTKRT